MCISSMETLDQIDKIAVLHPFSSESCAELDISMDLVIHDTEIGLLCFIQLKWYCEG